MTRSPGAAGRRAVLYVVATPLGNLEDITLRALRVLGEVDLIAAEDTRHSRKLLAHHGIGTPLTSYYDQIERQKAPRLIEELKRNRSIALICDAGTPCIADPGYRLVRAALAAGIDVEAVPGPSAVAAVLSISGLPTDRFAFEGFVPARAAARAAFYASLAREERTLVLYEAARRLPESLSDLHAVMGDRRIVVARELTKLFEEVLRGTASEVLATLRARAGQGGVQGEVTLVVEGAQKGKTSLAAGELAGRIRELREAGVSLKDIARRLAAEHGLSRRDVYQLALRQAKSGGQG